MSNKYTKLSIKLSPKPRAKTTGSLRSPTAAKPVPSTFPIYEQLDSFLSQLINLRKERKKILETRTLTEAHIFKLLLESVKSDSLLSGRPDAETIHPNPNKNINQELQSALNYNKKLKQELRCMQINNILENLAGRIIKNDSSNNIGNQIYQISLALNKDPRAYDQIQKILETEYFKPYYSDLSVYLSQKLISINR
jgi:hypothetical protein